ncbi:TetR/AcrR family transcriptional regulator [Rhodococcus sp. NPDC058521]|uniref:TetR/AcrR family transcriptional regulator n=1 Tax=Rhodococcus sp. NPDC058521 TaxID=3346536 RepID=UPI0036490312
MTSHFLPLIGAQPQEREDAARNRHLLLDAAALLVAERGVDAVIMDAVACRAGVGKGTVFRRFGSRSGLMQALLDHSERELQHGFMFGPPPLGPGADPVDRLVAFGRARIAIVEVQGDVQRAAEDSREFRFAAPARTLSIAHIVALLREANVDGDRELIAAFLFATLDAALLLHQIRDQGIPVDRIEESWTDLVRRLTRN